MRQALSGLLIFSFGVGLGISLSIVAVAQETAKPAYLIVSSDRRPGPDYGPYLNAAGPLAREVGLQMLACSKQPLVLEGNW